MFTFVDGFNSNNFFMLASSLLFLFKMSSFVRKKFEPKSLILQILSSKIEI